MELNLEDSLKQVLATLPAIIRKYVTEGKYTPVAQSLMRQYQLRIDQGGILERELLLLLMGVESPDEFVESLVTEAAISRETVDKIARDVNDQIFVPLRAEEMKATTAVQKTPAGAVSPRPMAPGTHFQLQNKIPLPQRPAAARPTAPAGIPQQALPQMPFDHLLEDREEPHIEFGKPQSAPAPRPAMAPQGSVPVRTAPPPNLPGQMPPRPAVSAPVTPKVIPPGGRAPDPVPLTVAPAPAVLKAPTPAAGLKFTTPPPPMTTKYSADPYREPIDEEEK